MMAWYRGTVVLLLVFIAGGVLWTGAERRKETCVAAGKSGCSLAPWSGDDRSKPPTVRIQPEKRDRYDYGGSYGP